MNRRQYVATLCGGIAGGFAGCVAPTDSGDAEATPPTEASEKPVTGADGQETVFGNTGHTWSPPGAAGRSAIAEDRVFGISSGSRPSQTEPTNDPNLVRFDEQTGSFWSQLLSQAMTD